MSAGDASTVDPAVIAAVTVARGTVRASDGAIMGAFGWLLDGRIWVTEQQANNATRFRWSRAPSKPSLFQGVLLYPVER